MLKYDISFIYKKVTELLFKYDRPYKIRSDNPSVNIWKVAQEGFGVKIKFISPWTYGPKHAVIEIKRDTVYIILNEKDRGNDTRCRFSIAHELGHLAFSHVVLPDYAAYRMFKYNIAHEWAHLFYSIGAMKNPQIPERQLKNIYDSFVRQAGEDFQITDSGMIHYLFRPVTGKAEKFKGLNYNVAHEWGRIVLDDNYSYKYLTSKTVPEAARHITSNSVSKIFRLLFIKNWGREELADHFAANLLVPIYRFQHYLDKSDKEIAAYFKVDEKCIKKRRKEFRAEMDVLTAAVKPLAGEITDPGAERNAADYIKKGVAVS
jgi:Zn-dependent peptidase ImmA (M78 family)